MFLSILQLVARLTKDIVEIYQICNPQFSYSEESNPKRFLTSPSTGVLNDGCDNANSDLILSVNLPLVNLETRRRLILFNHCSFIEYNELHISFILGFNREICVIIINGMGAALFSGC